MAIAPMLHRPRDGVRRSGVLELDRGEAAARDLEAEHVGAGGTRPHRRRPMPVRQAGDASAPPRDPINPSTAPTTIDARSTMIGVFSASGSTA